VCSVHVLLLVLPKEAQHVFDLPLLNLLLHHAPLHPTPPFVLLRS
jgi:hypothetical protein